VRHEPLVALIHDRAPRLALVEGGARRGFEIDDAAAQVRDLARPRSAGTSDVGPPLDRFGEAANVETPADAGARLRPRQARRHLRTSRGQAGGQVARQRNRNDQRTRF
jgi:hypothetical protein